MNVAVLLKKTSFVFLLLCFVISWNLADGERSVRLRKIRTHIAPRHISMSARSGNGVYARRYAYGRPIPSYSTKGPIGRNRRYYSPNGGRRRNLSRNYASGYRNWTPNFPGGRYNPRADKIGQKKRKELYPFLKEPPHQKRRVRPHRFNAMQKPRPPKIPNEFDEDYFFPEEAKRAETKYEYESRYPRPKKKRRPEGEISYTKPEFSKIPYYDDQPFPYKKKQREPPYSYSSFVQHPSADLEDSDDLYEDPDNYYPQPVRSKKKRVKKKSNSRKKNKDQFKPIVFESEQTESYPPYLTDDYELPPKRYKKRNKPSYDPIDDEEDFAPQKTVYAKPKHQVNSLFSTDTDYRGQHSQQTSQFSPSYSQPQWSQQNVVETTARPVQYQTENGFQPQAYIPDQYNYNKDYSTLQKVKTVTTTSQQSNYYSQPDNTYNNVAYNNVNSNNYNYVNTKTSNTQPQTQNNYNYVNTKTSNVQSQTPTNYNKYSSVYSSQSTYSQPVPAASPTLTDVTIQKSVPLYDNTETFYNFNSNAYVNSQSSKYNTDSGTKYYNPDVGYGNRLSSSYRNKVGEKTDSENEFIKKHQNLYNNGLSGVPVQGDGYAKETVKKDYDIGYGDFQFDENPTT